MYIYIQICIYLFIYLNIHIHNIFSLFFRVDGCPFHGSWLKQGHIISNPGTAGEFRPLTPGDPREIARWLGRYRWTQSTFPETHIFAPENGWLEDDPVSFWGLKRPVLREWIDRSFIFNNILKLGSPSCMSFEAMIDIRKSTM